MESPEEQYHRLECFSGLSQIYYSKLVEAGVDDCLISARNSEEDEGVFIFSSKNPTHTFHTIMSLFSTLNETQRERMLSVLSNYSPEGRGSKRLGTFILIALVGTILGLILFR